MLNFADTLLLQYPRPVTYRALKMSIWLIQLITTTQLPSHCDVIDPALGLQPYNTRDDWPIKIICYDVIPVSNSSCATVVASEQMMTVEYLGQKSSMS